MSDVMKTLTCCVINLLFSEIQIHISKYSLAVAAENSSEWACYNLKYEKLCNKNHRASGKWGWDTTLKHFLKDTLEKLGI